MQIDAKSALAGESLLTIRKLFRAAGLDGMLSTEFVCAALDLSPPRANHLVRSLVDAGYLERAALSSDLHKSETLWRLTENGIRLRAATAARALRRETADRLLSDLVARIGILNRDSYFLARVRRAVLFGSYLGDASRIGDLDVAIELIPREQDWSKHEAANSIRVIEEAEKGRSFANIVEQLFWWQREATLFLRNRKRGLSLHDYASEREVVESGLHCEVFRDNQGTD